MPRDTISLEIRNDISELDELCMKLEEFGKSLGLSEKNLFHCILAMEELCSNIISYGFSDNEEHLIKITAKHHQGILTLCVEDDGIPFNPAEAAAPDLKCPLEKRDVGGMGCHLINNIMDDIVYQRFGSKNMLTMTKAIKDC